MVPIFIYSVIFMQAIAFTQWLQSYHRMAQKILHLQQVYALHRRCGRALAYNQNLKKFRLHSSASIDWECFQEQLLPTSEYCTAEVKTNLRIHDQNKSNASQRPNYGYSIPKEVGFARTYHQYHHGYTATFSDTFPFEPGVPIE